jgi:hypothetical protein
MKAERFEKAVIRAQVEAPDPLFDLASACKHNDRGVRKRVPQILENLQAVPVREIKI